MKASTKGHTPKTELVELLTVLQILLARGFSYEMIHQWAENEIEKRTGRH